MAKRAAAMNPFEVLPLEVLLTIVQRLTVWELANLQSSCKFLKQALSTMQQRRPCILMASTFAKQSLASIAMLDVWSGRGMVMDIQLPPFGATLEACSDTLLCFMSANNWSFRHKIPKDLPLFAIANRFHRKFEVLPELDLVVSSRMHHVKCGVVAVHLLDSPSPDGNSYKLVVLWHTGSCCFVTIYDAGAEVKNWTLPPENLMPKDKNFLVGPRSSCMLNAVIYTAFFVKIPRKVILLIQYNTSSNTWLQQVLFEFPEDEEYSRRFDFWRCKLLPLRDELFLVGTNNRPGARNWMFKLHFGDPNKLVPYTITWQADTVCTDGDGNIFIKRGLERHHFNFDSGSVTKCSGMLPASFEYGQQSHLYYTVLSSSIAMQPPFP